MRTATILAALSCAATTYAQAVEIGIEPSSSAPEGCDRSPKGNFTIGYISASAVKKRETALADANGSLYLTLVDGVLTDGFGRTGSVVANHQFQFDGPPQAGALYTGGFSVCQNDSLAIGGTTRWWNCLSGTFNNLYDESIGAQCNEIRILATFVDQPTSSSSSSSVASSTAESSSVVTSVASTNGSSSTITSSSPASSGTLSAIPLTSINGTKPSGSISRVSTATPTATSSETGSPQAPNAPGAAAATAVSTFGAVIGLFAAAMML
ncbi:hypothetical protein SLS60_003666 [Paraconiothyrium brasiliense]|uniref:Cell wall mannoprotein PIR1-like C-terminal domain-containing protein n=1 Tax=Paraconiothyrium brasiliense TaxID=300254 RepID=A0ABR3RPB3_9PLEO